MKFYIDLSFFSYVESQDFLTYLALLLAYAAYVWSVNRDLESWKSLFYSFQNDLEGQSAWLKSEYFSETYTDKYSFSPKKIIYPLSFESLPEIIRRGPNELSWISKKLMKQLSLFNERVIAFNSLLDQIKLINAADPVKTEVLIDRLNDLCIDGDISFKDLKKSIAELKKREDIFYIAENLRRLNKILHVKVIGNKTSEDKLHFLYSEIWNELEKIIGYFDKRKPWFVVYKWQIIFASIPVFVLIEYFL